MTRPVCRCCLTLCVLQGASEDAPAKKEKVAKGSGNYHKVKEVRAPFFHNQRFPFAGGFNLLDLLHTTTCQSRHTGGACVSPRVYYYCLSLVVVLPVLLLSMASPVLVLLVLRIRLEAQHQ